MNRRWFAVLAAVFALCATAFAGKQDFMLANDTGVEIHQIFISSSDTADWQEDLLGSDKVLPAGNEVEIEFAPDEDAELWDVRVVDSEGTAIDWTGLQLTEIVRLTLQIEDGEPVATIENVDDAEAEEEDAEEDAGDAEAAAQDFTLANATGVDIEQIYISSADQKSWEEDLLDAGTILPDGNEVEIHFAPGEDAELWDIRVVDGEGTAIDFGGIDLTATARVTLQIEDGEPTATLE